MKRFLLSVCLVFISTLTYGNELEQKMKAVDRYFEATPMVDIIDDLAIKLASQLPEEDRAVFMKFTKEVDIPHLESIIRDALIKTYTLEEINAFADFYGSDVGKSIVSKLGTYQTLINKPLNEEVMRAISVVESET